MNEEPDRSHRRLTAVSFSSPLRRAWRLLATVAVLTGAVVAAPTSASGQATGEKEKVVIQAEAGAGNLINEDRGFAVTVSIRAPRLLRGTLEIRRSGETPDITLVPVEIAGGTTKTIVTAVGPTTDFDGGNLSSPIDVVLRVDGQQLASTSVSPKYDPSLEKVGLIGALGADLERRDSLLTVDAGRAHLSAISDAVLAAGPLAIESFDIIGLTPNEFDGLAAGDRSSLLRWVANGGHLLLDGDPSSGPASLPDSMDPAPATGTVFDLGAIRYTGDALRTGRYEDVLLPTPTSGRTQDGIIAANGFFGDVSTVLTRDAGFEFPSLRSLLFLLGVYIFVVGPVLWLALSRRGRGIRVWLAAPIVVVLAIVAVSVVGSNFRPDEASTHLTVIETSAAGATATSTTLVTASAGDTRIDLPQGWTTWTGVGFCCQGVTRLIDGRQSSVPVSSGPGGVQIVRARGPVDLDGALTVEASSTEDDTITGTITNRTGHDLHRTAVFFGRTAFTPLGDLTDGESQRFTIAKATHFDFDLQPELSAWPDDTGFGGPDFGPDGPKMTIVGPGDPNTGGSAGTEDEPSSLSAWGEVLGARGSNFKPEGEVVAVGWTRDVASPLTRAGSSIRNGRTAFVGRGVVVAAGPRLSDVVAAHFLVRGPGFDEFKREPVGGGIPLISATYGFTLPAKVGGRPVAVPRLRMHLPSLFETAEVWDGGHWVKLPDVPAGGDEVDIPDSALIFGTVFVRTTIPQEVPRPGRTFVIYERAAS